MVHGNLASAGVSGGVEVVVAPGEGLFVPREAVVVVGIGDGELALGQGNEW